MLQLLTRQVVCYVVLCKLSLMGEYILLYRPIYTTYVIYTRCVYRCIRTLTVTCHNNRFCMSSIIYFNIDQGLRMTRQCREVEQSRFAAASKSGEYICDELQYTYIPRLAILRNLNHVLRNLPNDRIPLPRDQHRKHKSAYTMKPRI